MNVCYSLQCNNPRNPGHAFCGLCWEQIPNGLRNKLADILECGNVEENLQNPNPEIALVMIELVNFLAVRSGTINRREAERRLRNAQIVVHLYRQRRGDCQ